jgi:membrane-associated protein
MTTLALGPSWLDSSFLIDKFGLLGVLAIVFAESGLLIGFFLPGDSLLFTTGLLITTGVMDHPLWLVCTLVTLAAIAGDQAGYLFGRKVGPALFNRPDSKLFKQENIQKAHEFFEKHGPKSLVLARFVPIVRTFTPIIAGVSRMNYRSFLIFNIVGGLLWGVGVTALGAALGKVEFVNKHIELILILIVFISVVPVIIELLRARKSGGKDDQGGEPATGTPGATAERSGGPEEPPLAQTAQMPRFEAQPQPHQQQQTQHPQSQPQSQAPNPYQAPQQGYGQQQAPYQPQQQPQPQYQAPQSGYEQPQQQYGGGYDNGYGGQYQQPQQPQQGGYQPAYPNTYQDGGHEGQQQPQPQPQPPHYRQPDANGQYPQH